MASQPYVKMPSGCPSWKFPPHASVWPPSTLTVLRRYPRLFPKLLSLLLSSQILLWLIPSASLMLSLSDHLISEAFPNHPIENQSCSFSCLFSCSVFFQACVYPTRGTTSISLVICLSPECQPRGTSASSFLSPQ